METRWHELFHASELSLMVSAIDLHVGQTVEARVVSFFLARVRAHNLVSLLFCTLGELNP